MLEIISILDSYVLISCSHIVRRSVSAGKTHRLVDVTACDATLSRTAYLMKTRAWLVMCILEMCVCWRVDDRTGEGVRFKKGLSRLRQCIHKAHSECESY